MRIRAIFQFFLRIISESSPLCFLSVTDEKWSEGLCSKSLQIRWKTYLSFFMFILENVAWLGSLGQKLTDLGCQVVHIESKLRLIPIKVPSYHGLDSTIEPQSDLPAHTKDNLWVWTTTFNQLFLFSGEIVELCEIIAFQVINQGSNLLRLTRV